MDSLRQDINQMMSWCNQFETRCPDGSVYMRVYTFCTIEVVLDASCQSLSLLEQYRCTTHPADTVTTAIIINKLHTITTYNETICCYN